MNMYLKQLPFSEELEGDSRLLLGLTALRQTPQRSPEAVARGRKRYLAEVESVLTSCPPAARRWAAIMQRLKEMISMSFAQRSTLTVLTSLLVAVTFLFGSAAITTYAAQSALPGDALYGVKTGLEQARLSLTTDPETQAEMYLRLARTRLDELKALVEQGKYGDVAGVSAEFQSYVRQALTAVQQLAQSNPGRAAEMNTKIAQALADFSKTLTDIAAAVPESIAPALQSALDSASPAAGTDDGNTNDANENGSDANANDDNANDGNANDDDGNANDDDGNGNDDDGNANDDDGNGNDDDGNGNDDDGNANDDDGNANDDDGNANDDDGNDNDDDGNDNDDDGGDDDRVNS